jgi:hypothetical protein
MIMSEHFLERIGSAPGVMDILQASFARRFSNVAVDSATFAAEARERLGRRQARARNAARAASRSAVSPGFVPSRTPQEARNRLNAKLYHNGDIAAEERFQELLRQRRAEARGL